MAFSTLRDLMIAATSDNVQVLAIVVCERFGNTLAISSETCTKVERILLPSPEPAPITFLKGSVGFFRDDCATQLGNNAAGVRFLGLAAALVASLGAFDSAKALDIMLKSSGTDLTRLPNLRQLNDLLASLEARSQRCGFVDLVTGWQTLLRNEVPPHILAEETRQTLSRSSLASLQRNTLKLAPSPEAIAGLVDIFREVDRMGPSTVLGATIQVGAAAPWVLAFAQWCIGPPSLYVEGKGAVLEQPGSLIRIIISSSTKDMNKPFEAIIHHQLTDLTRLLGPCSQILTGGMVTVGSYRTWLLQELGFGDGMLRMLCEALEHAIPQVLSKMRCGKFALLGQNANFRRWLGPTDNFEEACRLSPLADMATIANTCATILALEQPVQFARLGRNMLIADLPLVSRHLESLTAKCPCDQCCRSTQRNTQPSSWEDWCYKHEFFRSLSFIITDIFALSLFDSPSPLLVRLSLEREGCSPMIDRIISQVIENGSSFEFDDINLLAWARSMVGHIFDEEDRDLIMTYGKGQVIYPIVFDTFHIEKQGYLRLRCLPGILRYKDEVYNVVSCPDSMHREKGSQYATDDLFSLPVVSRPLNLFKDFETSWKISIQDNKELHAGLILRPKGKSSPVIEQNPLEILLSLRDTLLLESCPHDRRAPLVLADRFSSYSSPWQDHSEAVDSTSQVDVVAVDGADDLRCFAIACAGATLVIRRHSCLACCLNVCRDIGVHVLIL